MSDINLVNPLVTRWREEARENPDAFWAEAAKAIEVFRLNARLYPDSANVYDSLGEALELLRAEKDLASVLGEAFVTVYTEVKEIEHAEFMKVISPWEREHLLLNV